MMISTHHGFCFICVPKTASTAIERSLRRYADIIVTARGLPQVRHTTVKEYQSHFAPFLAAKCPNVEIETICVVREPLSWMKSWYKFRSRPSLEGTNRYTGNMSFSDFVGLVESRRNRGPLGVGTQSEFVLDRNGDIAVDRVFPMSRLDDLVHYLESTIGKPLNLEPVNVSPSVDIDVSDDDIAAVNDLLHTDLELYAAACDRYQTPLVAPAVV